MARKIGAAISLMAKDYTSRIGQIPIDTTG
jgi:hypothetical protein